MAECASVRRAHGEIYVEENARYDEPFGNAERGSGNAVEWPQVHCRYGGSEKTREQPDTEIGGYEYQRIT